MSEGWRISEVIHCCHMLNQAALMQNPERNTPNPTKSINGNLLHGPSLQALFLFSSLDNHYTRRQT
jgi:hypothetical protein